MKVVGLTGTIGAGKSFVKKLLLRQFNCYYVTLSNVIRGELERRKPSFNRRSLQDMGNELRQRYGSHILAKLAVEYMPRDKQLLIIDGIRNPAEAEWLREEFGEDFVLLAIDAPAEKRFEFLSKRGEKRDPKTMEEFQAMDARDRGVGEPKWGQQVERCLAIADYKVVNNGTIKELEAKVVEVMQKVMS